MEGLPVCPRTRLSIRKNKMDETKTPSVESETSSATVLPVERAPDDLNERVQSFNAELKDLLGKYELALSGEAFIANGSVQAKPVVVDARKKNGE